MKKIFISILVACSLGFVTAVNAEDVTIGSFMKKGVAMYPQGGLGGDNSQVAKNYMLDFKAVTLNGKNTFFLAKASNGLLPGEAAWEVQLRYWDSSNIKTAENQFSGRDIVEKSFGGMTTTAIPDPLKISVFCNIDGFSETELFDYNFKISNKTDPSDTEVPVLNSVEVTPEEVTANLVLNPAVSADDIFYYIEDAANGISTVSLTNKATLSGLTPNTNYNLSVTPLDFNGNKGAVVTKQFTTKGLVNITYGVAKDIRFMIRSTKTTFEYYCAPTDPTQKLYDVFVKVVPAGGTDLELKPIVSADGKYAYLKSEDGRLADKVLALNIGYLLCYGEGDPIWDRYVVENKEITSGVNQGKLIMHQMGEVSESVETNNPSIAALTLGEQKRDYTVLNIQGSDDSGFVYYEVNDGEHTAYYFHSGDNYLENLLPNKDYTLTVKAIDFSGNESEPKTISFTSERFPSDCSGDFGDFGTPDQKKIHYEISYKDGEVTFTINPLDDKGVINFGQVHILDKTGFEGMTIADGGKAATYTRTGVTPGEVYLISCVYGLEGMPGHEQNAENNKKENRIYYVVGDCGADPSSVDEMTDFEYLISPNPVKDVLTISSGKQLVSVALYDLSGNLLLKGKSNVIEMNTFSVGNYVVVIEDIEGNVKTFKVIKQ